jgi:hypothetical protein
MALVFARGLSWSFSMLIVGGVTVGAVGCGAAAPRLEAGVYRQGDIAFRVGDIPPTWRPVHVEGATLAYRDETHRASILLDARCYRKDDDVPLLALTDHLVMGTTGREFASQETLPFDGREAMHSRLHAKLDGVLMRYDIFVLKKDGCVYDFVFVAEPGVAAPGVAGPGDAAPGATESDDGSAAFERFTGSFHTLPGSGSAGEGSRT